MTRNISILGDSISTYEGYNPAGYAVFYDSACAVRNGMRSVYDTWWAQVIRSMGGMLCSNGSYSGSTVSGYRFPAGCSEQRVNALRGKYDPDIILIYLGFNDFGMGLPLRRLSGSKRDPYFFEDAYDIMLERIRKTYPSALVICGVPMRTVIRDSSFTFPEYFAGLPFEDYLNVIRRVSYQYGCLTADLNTAADHYTTLDGTHPDVLGHAELAQAWISCLGKLRVIQGGNGQ
ncbi:MAG: hypothetical protein K6G61_03115 [Solobacterium sp.]|nr:hypothetical protein [Solobacterium sp.]